MFPSTDATDWWQGVDAKKPDDAPPAKTSDNTRGDWPVALWLASAFQCAVVPLALGFGRVPDELLLLLFWCDIVWWLELASGDITRTQRQRAWAVASHLPLDLALFFAVSGDAWLWARLPRLLVRLPDLQISAQRSRAVRLFELLLLSAFWSACAWARATRMTSMLNAIYWAVVTLTLLGYGDITAAADGRGSVFLLNATVCVVGFALITAITANMTSFLATNGRTEAEHERRVRQLERLMSEHNLGAELETDIRQWLQDTQQHGLIDLTLSEAPHSFRHVLVHNKLPTSLPAHVKHDLIERLCPMQLGEDWWDEADQAEESKERQQQQQQQRRGVWLPISGRTGFFLPRKQLADLQRLYPDVRFDFQAMRAAAAAAAATAQHRTSVLSTNVTVYDASNTHAFQRRLSLAFLIYYCVVLPDRGAFRIAGDASLSPALIAWIVLEYVTIDVFFLVDLLRWRRSFVSAIASLPFELCLLFAAPRVWNIARLTRLVRLAELRHYTQELERWLAPGASSVLRLTALSLVFTYVVACGWHVVTGASANVAWYFATTTITTQGFGDVVPITTNQVVFAVVVIVIGASTYPAILSNTSAISDQNDSSRTELDTTTERWQHLLACTSSGTAASMVPAFLHDSWLLLNRHNDSALKELPRNLARRASAALYVEMLEHASIFEGVPFETIAHIASHAHQITVTSGIAVYKTGDRADALYAVCSGTLEVRRSLKEPALRTVTDGALFGDIECVLGCPREVTVVALTPTLLLRIDGKFLAEVTRTVLKRNASKLQSSQNNMQGKVEANLSKKNGKLARLMRQQQEEKEESSFDSTDDARNRQRSGLVFQESTAYRVWNAACAVLTAYLFVTVTVRACFIVPPNQPPRALDTWSAELALFVVDGLVDAWFVVDLMARLAFIVELPRAKARAAHMTWLAIFSATSTWRLVVLALSTIPVDALCFVLPGAAGWTALQIRAACRTLKLLRLFCLPAYVNGVRRPQSHLSVSLTTAQLAPLAATVLVSSHVIACLWYLVGSQEAGGWVERDVGIDASAGVGVRYVRSIYFAVSVLTTVGFGDIHAHTETERIVAMIVMVLGTALVAKLLAKFAIVVSNADHCSTVFQERLERVRQFVFEQQLPPAVEAAVNVHMERLWMCQRGVTVNSLLDELPAPVRTHVALGWASHALQSMPVLRGRQGLAVGVRKLASRVRVMTYAAGDAVFREGNASTMAFIVARGVLQEKKRDGSVVGIYMEGHTIADEVCVRGDPYAGTCRPMSSTKGGQSDMQRQAASNNGDSDDDEEEEDAGSVFVQTYAIPRDALLQVVEMCPRTNDANNNTAAIGLPSLSSMNGNGNATTAAADDDDEKTRTRALRTPGVLPKTSPVPPSLATPQLSGVVTIVVSPPVPKHPPATRTYRSMFASQYESALYNMNDDNEANRVRGGLFDRMTPVLLCLIIVYNVFALPYRFALAAHTRPPWVFVILDLLADVTGLVVETSRLHRLAYVPVDICVVFVSPFAAAMLRLPRLALVCEASALLQETLMLAHALWGGSKRGFRPLLRAATVAVYLLCIAHVFACVWAAVSDVAPESAPARRYAMSLYFAIVTLSSLGYGDIVPVTVSETLLVIVFMLVGAAGAAIGIANLASLFACLDGQHAQKRLLLKRMTQLRFGGTDQQSGGNAAVHNTNSNTNNDKSVATKGQGAELIGSRTHHEFELITRTVPAPALEHIQRAVAAKLFARVPAMLKGTTSRFRGRVAVCLRPRTFAPGATIFERGQAVREVAFGRMLRSDGLVVFAAGLDAEEAYFAHTYHAGRDDRAAEVWVMPSAPFHDEFQQHQQSK